MNKYTFASIRYAFIVVYDKLVGQKIYNLYDTDYYIGSRKGVTHTLYSKI